MDILGFAIAAFAAARLTRLATADTITAPLRDPVLARVLRSRAERAALTEGEELPPPTTARSYIYTLLTCHWCLGFWIALATVLLYLHFGEHIVYQIAAMTLAVSYVIGWFADNEGGE